MSDFFKGSNLVVQFFENVRRNDFCAELNVFILAITEDVFSDAHISIWPIALFAGLLRAHTSTFLADLFKRIGFFAEKGGKTACKIKGL